MTKQAPRRGWLAGLILVVLTIAGCVTNSAPTVIVLPNGYFLEPSPGGELLVKARGGHTAVPGSIAAYAVFRNIVTGALGTPPPLDRPYTDDLPYKTGADTRYFVLDTTNGHIDSGLERSAWQTHMTALGSTTSIDLHAPHFPK